MTTTRIVNGVCCIDTSDQTQGKLLKWKVDYTPGAFLSLDQKVSILDCDVQIVMPKSDLKVILPKLYVYFTGGVQNSVDGTCITIMKGSTVTTTQSNLSESILMLDLVNIFDIDIPGDTIYTYLFYESKVPYDFTVANQLWEGKIMAWDYRYSKTDSLDLVNYFDNTSPAQFPYLKELMTPIYQAHTKKKLSNNVLITFVVKA